MDEALLLWVNQGWAHPALDVFFIWLSSRPAFALPFALSLLALLMWRWKKAGAGVWLLTIAVVGLGDAAGNRLKDVFAEPRPCYSLADQVRQPGRTERGACGANLTGMPSNHALNAFATAGFLVMVFGPRAAGLFVLAALIALSRVYLGKHLPSQILGGAVIGVCWGLAAGWLTVRYVPFVKRIRAGGARGLQWT